MLKPAYAALLLPAREPPGATRPAPSRPTQARPLFSLPGGEETTTKESPLPPRPLSGPQPRFGSSPGYGKRRANPNACTNAAQTFTFHTHTRAHTHTHTHTHAQKRKLPGCTKEEGKRRGESGLRRLLLPSCRRRHRFFTTPVLRPPHRNHRFSVPLQGLGPLRPPHPLHRAEAGVGWGEKEEGGGVAGKSTQRLPTWSAK